MPSNTRHVPVHPMIVHFPIALWTGAPIAQGMYLLGRDPMFWKLAQGLVVLGVASGLLAALVGTWDLIRATWLQRVNDGTHLALSHARWMSAGWMCFALQPVLVGFSDPPELAIYMAVTLSIVGFGFVVVGGHKAGHLVYGNLHGEASDGETHVPR